MSVTSSSAASDVLAESVTGGASPVDSTPVDSTANAAPMQQTPLRKLVEGLGRAFSQFRAFLFAQPQWAVIALLYLLVWYTPIPGNAGMGDGPLAWSWQFWSNMTLPLGFQLYVPLAVGLLIWSRRAALTSQWKRLTANYPEHHPKREGNLLPLAAGALILIFAHFVEVKGVGVFAAILIAFGVVYRLYGSVITRMLTAPFAVFLLMIPPPDTFIDALCVGKTMNFEIKGAAVLLNLMHFHALNMMGKSLEVNGIPVDVSPHVYSGFGAAAGAAFFMLVYCLYRNLFNSSGVWMILLSAVAVFFLHVFRVVAIAATFGPQPDLSHFLASPSVAWIEMGIAVGAILLLMRARLKVQINAPLSVHHAVRMAGTGIETMALPLVGVGKVARLIGLGWTWSERRVERFLKAITPKRKRRRRRYR